MIGWAVLKQLPDLREFIKHGAYLDYDITVDGILYKFRPKWLRGKGTIWILILRHP